MESKNPFTWDSATSLAQAILHDRAERRKWLFYLILLPLGMMVVGLWVIDDWIWNSPWRVLFWWGGCATVTCGVLVFAIYDALAVIREERKDDKSDVDQS